MQKVKSLIAPAEPRDTRKIVFVMFSLIAFDKAGVAKSKREFGMFTQKIWSEILMWNQDGLNVKCNYRGAV